MNRTAILLGVASIALAGCSGSDYKNQTPAALPPAAQLDFTTFVAAQFAASATTETALPVEVDTTNFGFGDQDNPAAFNSLLVAP